MLSSNNIRKIAIKNSGALRKILRAYIVIIAFFALW